MPSRGPTEGSIKASPSLLSEYYSFSVTTASPVLQSAGSVLLSKRYRLLCACACLDPLHRLPEHLQALLSVDASWSAGHSAPAQAHSVPVRLLAATCIEAQSSPAQIQHGQACQTCQPLLWQPVQPLAASEIQDLQARHAQILGQRLDGRAASQ